MNYTNRELRDAWKKRFNELPWGKRFALTLTLKQRIVLPEGNYERGTATRFEENARFFFNTMNRCLYGKTRGAMVRAVTVLEKTERYHIHAVVEVPPNVPEEEFKWLIRLTWALSDWGYDQVWINEADDGWIDYMLKSYSKEGEFGDSILARACYLDEPTPSAKKPIRPELRKMRDRIINKYWSSPFPWAMPVLPGLEEFLEEAKIVETAIPKEEPVGLLAFL